MKTNYNMSTEELKYYLHESIEKIDNKNTLQAIKKMISHLFVENNDIVLSKDQKKRISEARYQVSNGQYTTDYLVREEVKKWIEK